MYIKYAKFIKDDRKMEKNSMYELTNPQKSIWLTEQYYHNTSINNICGSLIIKGDTDLKSLNLAINYFIKNNDSFKLRFKLVDGILMQYITEDEDYNFEILKIDNESQIENYAKEMVNTKFDLTHSRVFDFKLFKLSSGFGGFIVNVHHIISDAATFSLIATEIVTIYSKILKNETIPSKTYSYIDYINSEKAYFKSSRFEKDKLYWSETLSPLPDVATISMDNLNNNNCRAKRKEFILNATFFSKIKDYCIKNKISIFNFLIGVYSIYIGRINNMENFLLGTPILNRTNYAEKHTVGMFINTSLLKIDMSNNHTFTEFAQHIARDCMTMLKHQKYNYQHIVEDMRQKDNSIANLYDILLSYQITQATDSSLDIPYSTKWYGTNFIANTLDIHFHDNDDTGNLLVEYDYQIDKIADNEIENIHNRILTIIEQVLNNNDISINDIEIVTPVEKSEILNVFNTTKTLYNKDKDIVELFKEIVQKQPNKTALYFEGQKVSYSELNTLSDNLATYLSSFNVNYEDKIAIFLDKSIEMIISILGILKVNCAFLPIDIEYPKERIQYIIEDSNAKIAITTSKLKNKIKDICTPICLENLSLAKTQPFHYKSQSVSSLAYVMYTSGSTGKPKGVMIEQKSIIRLIKHPNFIKFNQTERILQTGSIVFDACTFEIWASLLNGFELYILKKEDLLNPSFLGNYLSKNKITILWLTAPLFNQLSDINPYMFCSVKYLLTGGDVLSPKHINKVMELNPNLKIINGYGPTENTTFSCCFPIDKQYTHSIPIGFPISGTSCYIVSHAGSLQPIGIPGELWVGGDGVSRGYLNNPELTIEKFTSNPFDQTSTKLYKTGDLVKWNPNGTIDFIGRIDGQVKIRGFRVELNEINNTILTYPNVKNSSTIIQTIDNSKEICAYLIPKGELDIHSLKNFLKTTLPTYMIPSYFVIMESFPITINGKIDKSKLPLPSSLTENKKIIEPKTALEREIYQLVKDLAPSKSISINDNFFNDIGLDSLNAMQLCSKLYQYNITIQDISDYPTIKLLSNKIEKHLKLSHFDNVLPIVDINDKVIHFDLGSILLTGSLGFLGMHILKELLLCDKVKKVYCLVRNKGNAKYNTRFFQSLKYYFNNSLDTLVENKVHLICGDFNNNTFGLTFSEYEMLTNHITTVIHCGANVKHYGNFQKINTSNVIGTQNIIDFCQNSNAKLAHISTISVGGYQKISDSLCLSEKDFNIGQSFNNHVYMITKYLAEYHVLNAINKNQIEGKIYRIGNIMPRISDNVFQSNSKDNALFNRLKSILTLGEITKTYKNLWIDFSPVDLCAKAILTIMKLSNAQTIYHIYNNHKISIKEFLDLAEIATNYISNEQFIADIRSLKDPLSYHLLNDLQHSDIITTPTKNDLTTKILNSNDFYWNQIDKDYINKLLKFV